MLKWLKNVAQGAKDFGASLEYDEAFDRLRGLDDYLLDFDTSDIPERASKVDLEKARALGTATELKQIAKRAGLLRTAHHLDMSEAHHSVTAEWPMAMKLAIATSLLPSDHRDKEGEEPPYFASSRDAILNTQHWHFSRPIASMSEPERLIWHAAMYWESQDLLKTRANEIQLVIAWAGQARLYATKPSIMFDASVWPLYLAAADKQLGEAIRGSYAEFLQAQVSFFSQTASNARLKRIERFDPHGVIGRIGQL